jgi:hypothetical protein
MRGTSPTSRATVPRYGAASRAHTLDALPTEDPADERLAKLAQLKGWYDEWAATARAVVKKRGYLIRLGLAQRKVGKKGEPTRSEE